jgi:ribosome-binding protein aMBF1 (putative translation factor)
LEHLQLRVQFGEQQVELKTDGAGYPINSQSSQLYVLEDCSVLLRAVANARGASAEEQQAFKQQVAAQTEQLLWLAYRLQLQQLAKRLQNFIRSQHWFTRSL